MARIFKVCYMEQPFNLEELDLYENYFEYIGNRRALSQDSVRAIEDDYMTCATTAEEELVECLTQEEYENFKDKIGEEYDLLLNGEIDYVEFE